MTERSGDAFEGDTTGPIIVGVDGSASSCEALAWAAEQARLTNRPLVVLTTWEWPTNYGYASPWPEELNPEENARTTLESCVDKVLKPEAREHVTLAVVHGHPAVTLLERSRAASLVVVGSRGHGAFTGMLLGSVSGYLASHAHSPVVIVRYNG